jgi:menaquinone-dependent protoporphyrinogen IX oxidase
MANVLVLYATHDGQTRKIAKRIANVLRVRRHVVELLDAARAPRDLDLSRFQAGAPLPASRTNAPEARA